MESGGAYGSSGATGEFHLQAYITKPQVVLRLVGWLFAIIVFGCISSQGWSNENHCVYNGSSSACGYGTAIGVLAFLALMAFLVLDALFDNISNIMHRKYIILGDISFSGLWTFMWFVCFCLLTNLWTKSDSAKTHKSGPEAAIAFSFFSIIIFAVLTGLAVRRYRQGIGSDFQSGYEPDIFGEGDRHGAPYSGPSDTYQGSSDYRQSPFADPATVVDKPSASTTGGYQGQSY